MTLPIYYWLGLARPVTPTAHGVKSVAREVPDHVAVEHLERGLVSLLRWLQDRATLDDLARQSGHALGPASWVLLGHLDTGGAMRVSDIAACIGVHTSSIIPRLKSLERAG